MPITISLMQNLIIFLASKVYVGRLGQFKAHYDAQAISKHIIKILKKYNSLLI
jgi:hypothetical protein